MCTLTWLHNQKECRVFFNRDEKRTRLPARPPEELVVNGTRVLAPVDGNAGGSWLAVNEFGIAVAVLNFYEADAILPDDGSTHESRGLLVLNIAACPSLSAVYDAANALDADLYRPFILTVFDEKGDAAIVKWDGETLVAEPLSDDKKPITTSSVKTYDVLKARRARYEEFAGGQGDLSDEVLRAFQHSRDECGGAYSVTMTREDAQTVSYSEVAIRDDEVTFFYQPRKMGLQDPPYLSGQTYRLKRA